MRLFVGPIHRSQMLNRIVRLAGLDIRSSVLAVLGGALGDRLGLVTRGSTLELLADGFDVGGASSGNGGGTTIEVSDQLEISKVV
jgi:hypothetical protein